MAVDRLFTVVPYRLDVSFVFDEVIGLLDLLPQIVFRKYVLSCVLCPGDEDEESVRLHLVICLPAFRRLLPFAHFDQIIGLRRAVDADIGEKLLILDHDILDGLHIEVSFPVSDEVLLRFQAAEVFLLQFLVRLHLGIEPRDEVDVHSGQPLQILQRAVSGVKQGERYLYAVFAQFYEGFLQGRRIEGGARNHPEIDRLRILLPDDGDEPEACGDLPVVVADRRELAVDVVDDACAVDDDLGTFPECFVRIVCLQEGRFHLLGSDGPQQLADPLTVHPCVGIEDGSVVAFVPVLGAGVRRLAFQIEEDQCLHRFMVDPFQ